MDLEVVVVVEDMLSMRSLSSVLPQPMSNPLHELLNRILFSSAAHSAPRFSRLGSQVHPQLLPASHTLFLEHLLPLLQDISASPPL